jgi:hypothetical protein
LERGGNSCPNLLKEKIGGQKQNKIKKKNGGKIKWILF